jgi:Zn-dependent protease with chaperone function
MTASAIDRVHFLEAQRRNRRRSLRFMVFAIVAVTLAGIPVCVLVAPLLFGLALVAAHLIDLVAPLGDATWERFHDLAFALPTLWARVRGRPVQVPWGSLALLYVAPGALLMLLSWPFIALLTRRAGAGALLDRLPSRLPDLSVLAEQQLVNVATEMAVAAGVRPPAVRIITSPAVNAVAIGLTSEDTTLLATEGLLEHLERDERQAIVAHLVGSVGNGDLEIAAIILSVFETWGLMALLLETPLDARRRTLMRQFVVLSARAARGRADETEARAMIDILLDGSSFDLDSFLQHVEGIGPSSVLQACGIMLVGIPVIATLGLAVIAARATIGLCTMLVLGPWLAAMWRARRRLADATAVQLTRHPDALARAVRKLDDSVVEVPGGWAVNFLFPAWPAVTGERAAGQTAVAAGIVGMRLDPAERLERLAALGASLQAGVPFARPGLAARLRAALPDRSELVEAIRGGFLAVGIVTLLIAVTLVAASLLLMGLWYLLRWLSAPLRWLRRRVFGF